MRPRPILLAGRQLLVPVVFPLSHHMHLWPALLASGHRLCLPPWVPLPTLGTCAQPQLWSFSSCARTLLLRPSLSSLLCRIACISGQSSRPAGTACACHHSSWPAGPAPTH